MNMIDCLQCCSLNVSGADLRSARGFQPRSATLGRPEAGRGAEPRPAVTERYWAKLGARMSKFLPLGARNGPSVPQPDTLDALRYPDPLEITGSCRLAPGLPLATKA